MNGDKTLLTSSCLAADDELADRGKDANMLFLCIFDEALSLPLRPNTKMRSLRCSPWVVLKTENDESEGEECQLATLRSNHSE
jgi:hypothetical protein